MKRNGMLTLVLFALLAVAGHAAAGETPAPADFTFEGTWVGAWPGWRNSSANQPIAVKVSPGKIAGNWAVEYSWEAGPPASGFNQLPGSIRATGREDGDKLVFKWTNKQGREFEVTLTKHEADKVKARLEKSGPTGPNERPYNETTLTRK